jgi:hypothetical protein
MKIRAAVLELFYAYRQTDGRRDCLSELSTRPAKFGTLLIKGHG